MPSRLDQHRTHFSVTIFPSQQRKVNRVRTKVSRSLVDRQGEYIILRNLTHVDYRATTNTIATRNRVNFVKGLRFVRLKRHLPNRNRNVFVNYEVKVFQDRSMFQQGSSVLHHLNGTTTSQIMSDSHISNGPTTVVMGRSQRKPAHIEGVGPSQRVVSVTTFRRHVSSIHRHCFERFLIPHHVRQHLTRNGQYRSGVVAHVNDGGDYRFFFGHARHGPLFPLLVVIFGYDAGCSE